MVQSPPKEAGREQHYAPRGPKPLPPETRPAALLAAEPQAWLVVPLRLGLGALAPGPGGAAFSGAADALSYLLAQQLAQQDKRDGAKPTLPHIKVVGENEARTCSEIAPEPRQNVASRRQRDHWEKKCHLAQPHRDRGSDVIPIMKHPAYSQAI